MDSSKSKSESPESAELDIAGRQCLATDVSHTIDYDHYVDSTPVGSVFGVMFSIMEQSGIGFVILGCLMVLVLILLFFKFLMSTFIIMVSAMGLVMIATAIVSRHNPIKADSEGISLPYIHLLSSNFQLDRHWTELGEL
ncbi:MAG: hypothetical protein K8F91_26420, partial [Candidatus Obscuribacterales bacterium]|nr:hypothetical protein [Candidatus Obscuribacterales bacterium]